MLEQEWIQQLSNLKSEYKDRFFCKKVDIEFENGLITLKKFLRIIILNKKKPLERHQFECLILIIPIIFEWCFGLNYCSSNWERLQTDCDLKHNKNCTLIVIKRQFGKTELLTRIAAAAILSFPNIEHPFKPSEWLIISHKGDHAKEILNRVYTYILEHKKDYEMFTMRKTLKRIELIHKYNNNDIRVINVHEGNIDGLAGKRFFGDEFFKWKEIVADEQFPPQLQIKTTCALLFSTLKKRGHWSLRWLNDQNELVFLINFAEICVKCAELEYEQATLCNHMRKLQAHFVNVERRNAIISLMPKNSALKEMYNIVPNTHGQVWNEGYLKRHIIRYKEEYFKEYFMFVDPSMTSDDGSFSGTTILGENSAQEDYICYLNTELTPSNTNIVRFIIKDLLYFVENFTFPNEEFTIFLLVEHNTVNHGREIYQNIIQNYTLRNKVVFIKAIKNEKRFGVRKKEGDEERFAQTLNDKMESRRILIHKNCITRNRMGIKNMISMLIDQCSHVRKMPSKTSSSKIKVCSKLNLNNKATNNDLYISLVSALHWTFYLKNPTHVAINKQYKFRRSISEMNEVFIGTD